MLFNKNLPQSTKVATHKAAGKLGAVNGPNVTPLLESAGRDQIESLKYYDVRSAAVSAGRLGITPR
jgi:hypothetical protein